MQLHSLQDTPAVSVYYDCSNDWLFADWHGALTLVEVQAGCLALAQCFMSKPCTHVLNSNSDVTSIGADVPAWLAQEFLPHIAMAGVQYVAWVSAPSLLAKTLISEAVHQVTLPTLAIFDHLDEAYYWLQQTRFPQDDSPAPGSTKHQAALVDKLDTLSQYLKLKRSGTPPAPEPDALP